MVCYELHDDNTPNNPVMTAIHGALPDILIDNTPSSFWGQKNNGVGCIPSNYTPLGIKVYSYVPCTYEAKPIDSVLWYIRGIATDGASGIFLDEVSYSPTPAQKTYLARVDSACDANGLKLIFNPGTKTFDSWLMSHCDLIMTDETYTGTRKPSPSELSYLDRVIVVNRSVPNTSTGAAAVSLGARTNGFTYSYACDSYTVVPAWTSSYMSLISGQHPATPGITQNGSKLVSSAPFGNQWYERTTGILAGQTDSTFTPTASGVYYTLVNLDGCLSDTSNAINFTPTAVSNVVQERGLSVYPNPAVSRISIDLGAEPQQPVVISLYDLSGRHLRSETTSNKMTTIEVGDLAQGIYFLKVAGSGFSKQEKIAIQRN